MDFAPQVITRLGKERIHPRYRDRAAFLDFIRCSYRGGEDWSGQGKTWGFEVFEALEGVFDTYAEHETESGGYKNTTRDERCHLWRHPREQPWEYESRLRMATYHNFVEPFVDVQARQVLRGVQGPDFGSATALKVLESDMDLRGSTLAAWRESLASWTMTMGTTYVLCDRPNGPKVFNRRQQIESGQRAFAQILLPLDLLDWRWNPGLWEFDWAKIRVRRPLDRDPFADPQKEPGELGGAPKEQLVTRVYFRAGVHADFPKGGWLEFVDQKPGERGYDFDFVPIVPVFAKVDPLEAEPFGVSLVRDVAYFARLAYNKLSWLTDQEAKQCFNQLVLRTAKKLSPKLRMALGTSRWISSEGGADFLSPDTSPMTHLIESMKEDERRADTMLGGGGKGGAGVESASALLSKHEDESALLSGLATNLENGEEAVWRMLARVEGVKGWEPEVRYNRDFSQAGRMGRAEMVLGALDKFSGESKIELQSDLLKALLPSLPPERMAELVEDLKAELVEQERKAEEQEAAAKAALAKGAMPGETEEPGEGGEPGMGKMGRAMMPGKTPLETGQKPGVKAA